MLEQNKEKLVGITQSTQYDSKNMQKINIELTKVQMLIIHVKIETFK